jgi:DNA-binding NarL/FixJ family response regulator
MADVILVDSSPLSRYLARVSLDADGQQVRAFSDPVAAEAELLRRPPDVLVLTAGLPEQGTARLLRAHNGMDAHPGVIVIVDGYRSEDEGSEEADLVCVSRRCSVDHFLATLRRGVRDLTRHRGPTALAPCAPVPATAVVRSRYGTMPV